MKIQRKGVLHEFVSVNLNLLNSAITKHEKTFLPLKNSISKLYYGWIVFSPFIHVRSNSCLDFSLYFALVLKLIKLDHVAPEFRDNALRSNWNFNHDKGRGWS